MRQATHRIDAGPDPRPSRRAIAWPLLAVFGILAVVQSVRVLPRLDDMLVNEGGATYLLLARSLASGSGYRHLSDPDEPPHVLFPPGFPVALAGLHLSGAKSVTAGKLLVLVLGLAAMPAAFVLLRARAGTMTAALITGWMVLHPEYLRSATKVCADAPYLLVSLLALLAIRASARQPGWRDGAGVGAWLATVAAALTRTVGLALVVSAPLYLAWCKAAPRWRTRLIAAALLTVCYGAPLITWECWKAANASSELGGYARLLQLRDEYDWDAGTIAGFGDISERLVGNARRCIRSLGGLVLYAGTDRQRSLLGLVMLGLIAAGMVVVVRRDQWGVEAYLLLAGVATLSHPAPQLPRYLLPMLPFVLFYPAMLLSATGRFGRRAAHVGLALAVVAGIATHDIDGPDAVLRPAYREYRTTARWLGEHTPPRAVVLCRKPDLMYLWSDRKSVAFPFSRDLALMDERVTRNRVTHVVEDIISRQTTRFLQPWLAARGAGQALIYEHGDTRVRRLGVEVRAQEGT